MHLLKSFILLFILVSTTVFAGTAEIKVIYGDDDRDDVVNVSNPLYLKLAISTAAMIKPQNISEYNNEQVKIGGKVLADNGVCKIERFSTQPVAASCSGFLVAKNQLVTAGHCIRSQADCDNYKWVFDYKVEVSSDSEVIMDKKNVYSCKKIISQKLDRETQADYALIELTKEVSDRAPLSYRKSGKPAKGDALVVIGHPSGLPTKIADGANIRAVNDIYLTANLDTYGGNSGSAVFNATTGIIEGILVRGETDYIFDDELGCRVSNQLANNAGDGEEVTLITIVKGLDLARPPKPEPPVPSEPTPPSADEPAEPTPAPAARLSFWQRLLRLFFG